MVPPPPRDLYNQGAYYGGPQMGDGGGGGGGGMHYSPTQARGLPPVASPRGGGYRRINHLSVANMYANPEHDHKKAHRQQRYKEELERQIQEKQVWTLL